MRTSNRLRVLLALVCALVLVSAACGDDDDTDTAAGPTSTEAPAAGGDEETIVTIDGFQFSVPESVAAGSTLQIRNMDSAPHTVTADDGAFDSTEVGPDSEGEITVPSEPGTYAFHCNIHSSMKGELVVA